MTRSSQPCKTANLPKSVQQRLNMYAIAAGASGLGVLALTLPTEGKIVYTPTHKVIGLNHKVPMDLNHDGRADFIFHETFITTTSVGENHSILLSVIPARKTNGVLAKAASRWASALRAGVQVGPKGPFSYQKKGMAVDYYADGTGGSGTCAGLWNNVKHRFLGLKFTINGKDHFGWARLNVTCISTFTNHEVQGVLTGYAYETIPNKAIITGKTTAEGSGADQPATLGRLALGRK